MVLDDTYWVFVEIDPIATAHGFDVLLFWFKTCEDFFDTGNPGDGRDEEDVCCVFKEL